MTTRWDAYYTKDMPDKFAYVVIANYDPTKPILVRQNLAVDQTSEKYGWPLLRVSLTEKEAQDAYQKFKKTGAKVSVIQLQMSKIQETVTDAKLKAGHAGYHIVRQTDVDKAIQLRDQVRYVDWAVPDAAIVGVSPQTPPTPDMTFEAWIRGGYQQWKEQQPARF